MISVLCMRPPRVRLGPFQDVPRYQVDYIKGRGDKEGAPFNHCTYGSQHPASSNKEATSTNGSEVCCCLFRHGV